MSIVKIGVDTKGEPKTPMQAIRRKCLDCCCDSYTEVENCTTNDCALWTRRFGKRPDTAKRKGKKVDESESDE
jgi:hypothetical protein